MTHLGCCCTTMYEWELIKKELGWEPEMKLIDGITLTYQWIKKQVK